MNPTRRSFCAFAASSMTAALLAACGTDAQSADSERVESVPTAEPTSTEAPPAPQDPAAILANFRPDFDVSQTTRMSTFMLGGQYAYDGDTLFGLHYDDEGNPGLAALKLSIGTDYIRLVRKTMLDTECTPYYVTVRDGYVFYERYTGEGEDTPLCRIWLEDGEREVVVDSGDHLRVRSDRLYYTDAAQRYVCCDYDGNDEQVLIDTACYFPYPIDDDWILYQDDTDSEALHVRYLPTDADVRLAEGHCYGPVIDGTTLWFTRLGADQACHLVRMDVSTYGTLGFFAEQGEKPVSARIAVGAEQLMLKDFATGAEHHAVARDDWQSLEQLDYDADGARSIQCFVSPDYEVVREVNDQGNTTALRVSVPGSTDSFPLW